MHGPVLAEEQSHGPGNDKTELDLPLKSSSPGDRQICRVIAHEDGQRLVVSKKGRVGESTAGLSPSLPSHAQSSARSRPASHDS